PYRVVGGPRFYERLEIRDALAYLRIIQQPDDDLAFERIVNKPKRAIGDTSVQLLHKVARAGGVSLYRAAAELVETDELKPRTRSALAGLIRDFGRWRALAGPVGEAGEGPVAEALPHAELAEMVLDESGYTAMLMADKSPEAPGRLENLKELVTAMAEFENLAGFLEHVSLVMENTEQAGRDLVSIMTLHAAKGLEFDNVFLPGWEEGLFPHQRNMDENGAAGLEEERRLAYVGLTRARKRAFVSFAANRRVHGQWQSAIPSRFIDELPTDHVTVDSDSGLYGGNDDFTGGRTIGGSGFAETPRSGGGYGWGWARGNAGSGRSRRTDGGAPTIDAKATLLQSDSRGFAVGERIFHQKYGYGRIARVEGNKLEIAFEKAGTKKVLDSFVVSEDARDSGLESDPGRGGTSWRGLRRGGRALRRRADDVRDAGQDPCRNLRLCCRRARRHGAARRCRRLCGGTRHRRPAGRYRLAAGGRLGRREPGEFRADPRGALSCPRFLSSRAGAGGDDPDHDRCGDGVRHRPARDDIRLPRSDRARRHAAPARRAGAGARSRLRQRRAGDRRGEAVAPAGYGIGHRPRSGRAGARERHAERCRWAGDRPRKPGAGNAGCASGGTVRTGAGEHPGAAAGRPVAGDRPRHRTGRHGDPLGPAGRPGAAGTRRLPPPGAVSCRPHPPRRVVDAG
ncbi:unnamed protein product, partial [Discosporangium mesarthrocarpum]